MSKDTDEDQPVSIEDEIKSIIASGEEEVIDDEVVTESEESDDSGQEIDIDDSEGVEPEDGDAASDSEEEDLPDGEEDGDDTVNDSDTSIPDNAEGDDEDKLEAPEHWAASDREVFNSQTEEAKEFLLRRHKEMEGNMTRKSQEFASDKRQYDAMQDALKPYEAEFAQAGLDQAGAVRQLASWHNSLKTGGKDAILQLANMYQIDMSDDGEEEYTDPAIQGIQQQVSELKNLTAQQQQAAQREKQNQLASVINQFQTETDETGALKHPHFEALYQDMTMLFNNGRATDLGDAYNKALLFHPDLNSTPKVDSKPSVQKSDQAAKVKKAKKAATGIKSSGATKVKRAELTLEEEIASQM